MNKSKKVAAKEASTQIAQAHVGSGELTTVPTVTAPHAAVEARAVTAPRASVTDPRAVTTPSAASTSRQDPITTPPRAAVAKETAVHIDETAARVVRRFSSHVDVPDQTREHLIRVLNLCLATTIDLRLQVKQAHWNVKGPHFFSLHQLFDAVASRLESHADVVAERVATLGGYALGTAHDAASRSAIARYSQTATTGVQHVTVLVDRFAGHTRSLRAALRDAETLGEPVTVDVLTGLLRAAEQDMWLLESHVTA